jgi:putative addiction module component (TIGR02574 family)
MATFAKLDILNLSIAERILLVQDIWDSIATIPELTEDQKAELEARLESYQRDPDAGSPSEAVLDRIRNRS